MLDFIVDRQTCTGCGECAADCPARIIELIDGIPAITPENESACYRCRHCLAVCPSSAVSILGRRPEASRTLSGHYPQPGQLETLIKGRRSVRRYRQENVDPGLIRHLLEVAWHAPTGRNCRRVMFTLVDDRQKLAGIRGGLMEGLGSLAREGGLPEGLEFFADLVRLWEERGVDFLFRGAPHLLVATAPQDCASPLQDCMIALSYFELFAQANGIGTVWDGLAKLAINDLLPQTRQKLGIPGDHVFGYAMAFGIPDVSYSRTVQHGPPVINTWKG
jgi:nitroreductase/NAD-dependent dihydropyrimidine dehydrogenase PreA subunit